MVAAWGRCASCTVRSGCLNWDAWGTCGFAYSRVDATDGSRLRQVFLLERESRWLLPGVAPSELFSVERGMMFRCSSCGLGLALRYWRSPRLPLAH
jgi:hypothetical protein